MRTSLTRSQINPIIQARLPLLNDYKISDYIPLASTITNLGLLALKGISSLYSSSPSYSHTWLNGASHLNILRSCLLLVPVIGNIAVYLYDKRELDRCKEGDEKLTLKAMQNSSDSVLDRLYAYSHLSNMDHTCSYYGRWVSEELEQKDLRLFLQDLFQLLQKEPHNPEALGAASIAIACIWEEERNQFLPLLQKAGYDSWEALATQAATLNPKNAAAQTNASFWLNDTPKSLSYCVNAVRLNPNSPWYWNNLKEALEQNNLQTTDIDGQSISITDCLVKAIELRPKRAQSWVALGDYSQPIPIAIFGELFTREQAYIRALNLDPDHADTWRKLGQLLRHKDMSYPLKIGGREIHHAYECHIQSVELDPDNELNWTKLLDSTRNNNSSLPFPSFQIGGKQINSQAELTVKALELHPNSHLLWNDLGITLFFFPQTVIVNQQTITSRHTCYAKSIELEPNNAVVWDNLGKAIWRSPQTVLIHGKPITSARECFAKAVSLDPKDAVFRNNLEKASSWAQNRYRALSETLSPFRTWMSRKTVNQ